MDESRIWCAPDALVKLDLAIWLSLERKKRNTAMRTSNGSKNNLQRRNLTLPDSCVERIANIRTRTEAASDSEVVRRAIRLYEVLLNDSTEVFVREKATGKEKALPAEVL